METKTADEPPVDCTQCRIGKVAVYAPTLQIRPAAIAACRKQIVSFAAERTICRHGEPIDSLYTLYSGWAYRAVELSGTRRQIISFFIPGDTIPLEGLCFAGMPLPYLVKSLTPVRLCRFPPVEMIGIVERSERQSRQTRATLQEYCEAMNRRMADIGRRSAMGRLAQLILEIHDRLKQRRLCGDGEFVFPARQDDIADALGLTSVHVSRTLVELRRRGLIDCRRDRFRILDMKSLRHIAEDE